MIMCCVYTVPIFRFKQGKKKLLGTVLFLLALDLSNVCGFEGENRD